MEFPLIILLLPYAIALAIFLFFSFFNLYHLRRFSIGGWGSFLSLFYILVTVLILVVTLTVLIQIDWSASFQLSFGSSL